MPMTHVPEIGAENPYQKTGTINWHENRRGLGGDAARPGPSSLYQM